MESKIHRLKKFFKYVFLIHTLSGKSFIGIAWRVTWNYAYSPFKGTNSFIFMYILLAIILHANSLILRYELSLCVKLKYSNSYTFGTRCCKPLIFQIQNIWSNRIHGLKYLRSTTFGSKDIVIRKSEFVAKTQFLCDRVIYLKFFVGQIIFFKFVP